MRRRVVIAPRGPATARSARPLSFHQLAVPIAAARDVVSNVPKDIQHRFGYDVVATAPSSHPGSLDMRCWK